MKKFLAILLSMMLVFAVCPFAYADGETFVDTGSGSDYEGSVTVGFRVFSTYTISIPYLVADLNQAPINVYNANMEAGYHLSVYATNLDENYQVDVYTRHQSGGEMAGKAYIYVDGGVVDNAIDGFLFDFTSDELLQPRATHYIACSAATNGAEYAGVYRGTLCLRVKCLPDD